MNYSAAPPRLGAILIEPNDARYDQLRSSHHYFGSPRFVFQPKTPDDVGACLGYAREQQVPLAIRSGGHGISSRSTNDGGVVIDLANLNQVEVLDTGRRHIRLGPGARWGAVARALAPHKLVVSSGDSGDVGVGGVATAGGIGLLAREDGLTIDHILAVELLLANGSRVRAEPENEPDLFWAVRGAGGNFGIATAIELRAHRLQKVVLSAMVFDGSAVDILIERWGEVVQNAPRKLTSFLNLFAEAGEPPIARLLNMYADDDTQAAEAALKPLLKIGRLLRQRARLLPYAASIPLGSSGDEDRRQSVRSCGLARKLTPELTRRLALGLRSQVAPWLQIRSVGAAVNDVDPMATAYAHRHQNFCISSGGPNIGQDEFRRHWDELRPLLDGLYLSFETDRRPERLNDAFPDRTLTRLRHLKARYDPDNVFDQNFPVAPRARSMTASTRHPTHCRRVEE